MERRPEHFASDGYYDIVRLLVASGATVEDGWLDETDRGLPVAQRISEDPACGRCLRRIVDSPEAQAVCRRSSKPSEPFRDSRA